jgi:hypothetical protein
MLRRDFLDCIAAPLLSGFGRSGPGWLFRMFPGRIDAADPLRQSWQRLCPNTHLWFEAVAAQSMPQTAVLAWFPSLDICRSASPSAAELFKGPVGDLRDFSILECRESGRSLARVQKRVLRNSRCVLIGFHDLAERWRISDREIGRVALFRAEPG